MILRALLFLILFYLAGCGKQGPDSAGSADSARSYELAYNVAMNADQTDYDIFVVDLDGSNHRNITNHPGDVAWTYLAGQDKVFFISDRDSSTRCYFLYEMDPSGNKIRKITDFRLADSWMDSRKNGKELIVMPHSSVDSAFYIIDLSGARLQRIETGLPHSKNPCFSPDGQRIAFTGANKKSKREQGFQEEIYLIQADGSGLKRLTQYPPADTTAPWYAYKAGPPRWHPTENFISYQSLQNGRYSLYAVAPDGSRQWKLTENTLQEGWHDWSPDGHWLAIELFDAGQNQFHIGLMDWQNRELSVLTDTTYRYQQAPAFITLKR